MSLSALEEIMFHVTVDRITRYVVRQYLAGVPIVAVRLRHRPWRFLFTNGRMVALEDG